MNPCTRRRFDDLVDEVLAEMPPLVHELIERIPLHVEDHPSAHVMARTGVRRRDRICGLFVGFPITEKTFERPGTLPDVVTIYREGILQWARDRSGRVRNDRLRKLIRITILHELAHFHGLGEEELREIGYG